MYTNLVLDSAVLRAILFTPAIVFFALCVAVVVWQSSGRDPENLYMAASGAGSFSLYFYAGLLVLSLFSIALSKRALGGLALAIGLFLVLAVLDVLIKDHHTSGGFINLDFNFKFLWLIPGMFLTAPLQHMVFDSVPVEPHLTSTDRMVIQILNALPAPDQSIVLVGRVSRERLSLDWRLLSRLDAKGNVDAAFVRQPFTLPQPDFIRPRPDGTALISWRDGSANKVGTVDRDGKTTLLFELSPTTSELVTAGNLTDAATDASGRLLLAGVLEKTSSTPPGYAQVNYPLARFDGSGRLDSTFVLLELPRIFESGRVVLAPDGGILVDYVELGFNQKLRRLLPDGRPDTAFETGLAESIERLQHGVPRAATFDNEGRVLVVLQNEGREDSLLLRLEADGRPFAKQQATIPWDMGHVDRILSHPDGSVFVIVGNEKADSLSRSPWHPVLLHFTPDLQPDEPFNSKTAPLGQEFLEMKVLALTDNGGVIVSLCHFKRESRVLYLARDGSVEKQVQF